MLVVFLDMGNKLVCCLWYWIESPGLINHMDSNCSHHSSSTEKFSNVYVNSIENIDMESFCEISKSEDGLPNEVKSNDDAVTNLDFSQQIFVRNSTVIFEDTFQQFKGESQYAFKSTEQLQRIIEREPEDVDNDPSINAKNPTLFLKMSKIDSTLYYTDQGRKLYKKRGDRSILQYSSCSRILLDDTTISQPNPAMSLKTLALAVHMHVRCNDTAVGYRCSRDDAIYSIFDERLHPVIRHSSKSDLRLTPTHREIYRFLRDIFNMAQLTPECAIITLVYLERLLTSAEMEITPWSWRRQLLGSILLASKVWDDQAVWNVDYCQILKDLSVEDINELERDFLNLIQFHTNVPSSVYAHYYFDLLQLGWQHGLVNKSHNRRPLCWDRAVKLEALDCPAGPNDDYSTKWFITAESLTRSHSCESFSASRMVPRSRRVIIS